MTRELGENTWHDLWNGRRRPLLVIPVGSCEQHGPHLPLDTDTRIAEALARSLAEKYDDGDVMVAPTLAVTASGEHAHFPGTLSIGAELMEQVLIEYVRSADWSSGVVLVNGHGGNAHSVSRAVRQLVAEGRRVLSWWPQIAGADAHAGHTETSIMLALAPHLVRMDRAEAGATDPIADIIDTMRAGGVQAVSENGVLGDPRRATAAHGHSVLARLAIDLLSVVDDWWE